MNRRIIGFAFALTASFLTSQSFSEQPSEAPRLLLARGEDGKATLSFSSVPGAKTYVIRVASGDGRTDFIEDVEVVDYTVHGLRNNLTYRFAVAAESDGRRGPWSNELPAMPVDEPSWIVLRDAFLSRNPTRSSNPFTMVHGRETEAELRSIVRAAYDAGFEGVTLHPYDYDDYLGPGQWDRWKIIFDQAHRLGLVVWQQDDRNYPSGFACGKVTAAHPEYGRTFLTEATQQVVDGPKKGFTLAIKPLLKDRDFLVAVSAYPENGEPLDLTKRVAEGTLKCDIPAGKWRLFVVKAVWGNGGPYGPAGGSAVRGYIDFLNPRAVDAYIDTVYGSMFAQFPKEFGRTFKGYFTDEAPVELRQFTPDFLERFEKSKGYSLRRHLPSLWHEMGTLDRNIRSDYRDFIREQNTLVFFGRSREWCHNHRVQLIGHVIEDHQQDMRRLEMLDIPGCDEVVGQWYDPEPDVYWRQPRMASSVAHYMNRRNDLALIEHFAATGWRTGLSEMKRMMDWSTAMGTNQIVPCGLDTQSPPVWEVAPDFWLHGANPQWPVFPEYQAAANRMTMLMRGGRHIAPAILLDTTESRWIDAGADLSWCHPARDDLWRSCAALSQAHVDFDIVPYYVFDDIARTKLDRNVIHIGNEDYRAVIVPGVDSIPVAVAERLRDFRRSGGVIVALNSVPTKSCDGQNDERVRTAVNQTWGPRRAGRGQSAVASYENIGQTLTNLDVSDVRMTPSQKAVLYYHRQINGKHVYFFANTSPHALSSTLELRGIRGVPMLWNPVAATITRAPDYANKIGGLRLKLAFGEYESMFVVIEPTIGLNETTNTPAPFSPNKAVFQPSWQASQGVDVHHRRFAADVEIADDWPMTSPACLELRGASQIISVEVNGKPVGRLFCSPYRFEVGKMLQKGVNHILVERIGRIVLPNQIVPTHNIDDAAATAPCSQMTLTTHPDLPPAPARGGGDSR